MNGHGIGRTTIARLTLCRITLAVVAAVAITLALAGCGSKQSADFTGYWQGSGAAKDLVIHIDHSGDAYAISGSSGSPLPATLKDGELASANGVVYSLSADGKTLTLRFQGPSGQIVMTRPTASTAALAAQVASQAQELAVREGLAALQQGIENWWVEHENRYPAVAVVQETNKAFAALVTRWPTNPFTKAPMSPGSQPGDYTYTTDGKTFTLTGHLPAGKEIASSPSPAP
jgi:hypothetical protein